LLLSIAQYTFVPKTTKTQTTMLPNEQKKQSLEHYINQSYTQQQILNAFIKSIPTSQEMEIMRKQTMCITINTHQENLDSEKILSCPEKSLHLKV